MIGFKIKTRYVLVTSSPISTYMRCCQLYLEVEGFEPRATLAACRFSRPIPSARLGYTSILTSNIISKEKQLVNPTKINYEERKILLFLSYIIVLTTLIITNHSYR